MRVEALMRYSLLLLLLAAPLAFAQGTLEIIPLKHRTVDQVLPALRPLVEPGGVLSGQANQLIVRTSARNLEEIKAALAVIDTAPRRLQISVRFDAAAESSRSGVNTRGVVGTDRSRIDVRIEDARERQNERVDQRIQVLEGGRAFIATGDSRPLRQRQIVPTPSGAVITDSTVMHDVTTGFDVVPHVSGRNVFLDIAPQRETRGATPGSVQAQRVATTVSGPLGEWLEIGGAVETSRRDASGILSSSERRNGESRRIWVKVDEVKP